MRTFFCKHYRAMASHDTCEAGIAYEQFKGMPFENRPCFGKRGKPNNAGCEKADMPTEAELAARDEELRKTLVARAAIVEACGGPWKKGKPSTGGTIDCPVCKAVKSLRYSRAGYNGHIHAACKTEGCVSWME